jgi:Ca-activated chloride channel homolog
MRSVAAVIALCGFAHAQTFNSNVEQVAVPVTVSSERNAPLSDLRPNDFRVFDDGRPVPIVAFGRVRQSVHMVLLLDTSASMMQSLPEVSAAATALVAHLGPDDSVQVGTFSSSLQLSPPLSAPDHQMVERLRLVAGGNTTILYDALIEGCGAFTNEMSRRAIFVVSDGVDTSSSATARTVMQRAAEANVAIYAVGVSGRYVERGKPIVRPPDATLRQIAEDTGGRYVFAGTGEGLSQLFASMVEELYQQYMLGFTPAQADGRLHSLIVTTSRPNVTIRARKHYLAPISAQ